MKKNIIKYIKEHDNIFVALLIVLSVLGVTLCVIIESSDEIWNFQNVYKMYNGFQIYKDANVIVTPLFFYLGVIIFKVLGANLFVFRIYNVIILEILFFTTYLLLKKLKISKKISTIIILLIINFCGCSIVLIQANYNLLALAMVLVGIYNYLKNKYNKYAPFYQGILSFLIFMTKQNIGIYYIVGLFIAEILLSKKSILNIVKEIGVFIFLSGITAVVFYYNNILDGFVNYALLGISEFAQENIIINIYNIVYLFFINIINIIVSIVFVRNKKIKIEEEVKENLVILNSFSVMMSLVVIPIVNDAHFYIAIYVAIVLFVYIISIIIRNIGIKINFKLVHIILIIMVIFSVGNSLVKIYVWQSYINDDNYYFEYGNPFFGGILDDEEFERIEKITNYIGDSEKKVIVMSNEAALYMTRLKESNGLFDLPFKGNFGRNGENGVIDKLKEMSNIRILIEKDEEKLMWQESKKIREYIINNMVKTGEIENFVIYE